MHSNPPYLLTYPRSGSHYFHQLFYQKTGIRIEGSHTILDLFYKDMNKTKQIITIVRDPKETAMSILAVQSSYGQDVNKDFINHVLSNYILFYKFLYEHADYVIDFNDLVNDSSLVINNFMDYLNIKIEDNLEFTIEDYKKFNGEKYLGSSQNLKEYKTISLVDFNTDLCYYEYNKLLEKKIII